MNAPGDVRRRLAERNLIHADATHDRAAQRLSAAFQAALPMGSYVEIPSGRGTIRGHVVGHGAWWSDPCTVAVRVLSSGNRINCHIGHLIPDAAAES